MSETLGPAPFRPLPDGPPDFAILDVHVHLGPSDSGEVYYPTLSGAEYLVHAQAAGVVAACAFPPYRIDGYQAANAALRDWSAGTQGRVAAFARLGGRATVAQWPPRPWQVRRVVRRARRGSDVPGDLSGFAGIKLLPHLDGMPPKSQMDEIADRRLAVLVHAGRFVAPRWVARHVLPRTTGPVILAHLGAFPHEPRLLADALTLARAHSRLYLDTSGVWDAGFLRQASRTVPDKIVFGSDAPLTTPAVAWSHLATAVDNADALRLIGHDTPVDIGLLAP